jgi:hypothetical protein
VRVCSADIPLAVSLTGGNRNDVTQLMPLIQAILPALAAEDPGSGGFRQNQPICFISSRNDRSSEGSAVGGSCRSLSELTGWCGRLYSSSR